MTNEEAKNLKVGDCVSIIGSITTKIRNMKLDKKTLKATEEVIDIEIKDGDTGIVVSYFNNPEQDQQEPAFVSFGGQAAIPILPEHLNLIKPE